MYDWNVAAISDALKDRYTLYLSDILQPFLACPATELEHFKLQVLMHVLQ